VSLKRINGILGIKVPAAEVLKILKRLNFEVERNGDTLEVTAPRYREDIEVGEPDLAEEVIREYGYDHVVPTFLKTATVTSGGKNPAQQRRDRAGTVMCSQGYNECYTLSFYADSDLDALKIPVDAPERNVIRIQNPISEKLSVMRPLLAPSLLNIVVENLKKGNNEGRIFEISNVYVPAEKGQHPEERPHLGFAAFGDSEDFFTVKGSVETLGEAFRMKFDVERAEDVSYLHPGIAAYILCEGERIGVFGKLANEVTGELKLHKDSKANHKIFLGEIDYEKMMSHAALSIRYQPVSVFPTVIRDLALTVDEGTTCGSLMTEIARACPYVTDVELFDIYRGEQIGAGKKSMAFKITFTPADKALTPEDVDRFIKKILGNLKFKLGAEIR
jgi:phenylalanyl-tRNA synthetase beta chain